MTDSLLGGGLVARADDHLILCDLQSFDYTHLYNEYTGSHERLEDGMWFMNVEREEVYYSDHSSHHLRKVNLRTNQVEEILAVPCYGLTLVNQWLYYMNEQDQCLYRCSLNGRNVTKVQDEPITGFIVDQANNRLYYTTMQGIRRCQLDGGQRDVVSDDPAALLLKVGDNLVFASRSGGYALSLLSLSTNNKTTFGDIVPLSMIARGSYLYCADASTDGSLVRIDVQRGSTIRIYGEPTDRLHLIGEFIYFSQNQQWHRLSLTGGQSIPVNLPS